VIPIAPTLMAVTPLVLIVGRVSTQASGVRGEAYAAGQRYFQGITHAGGTPVMLPPTISLLSDMKEILRRFDGVVLHGGGDVDPLRYGQERQTDKLYGIVAEHDEVEIAVARAAVEADVAMLAICRGMQVLNVAMGGTLHQDIGGGTHSYSHHAVDLEPTSRLATAMGPRVMAGHCVHHQTIDRVADGLEVVGHSADGLIHAAEVRGSTWAVATQWHPEDTADTDHQQQALFNALIAQA
jgi:putative glutamine amidotransferase